MTPRRWAAASPCAARRRRRRPRADGSPDVLEPRSRCASRVVHRRTRAGRAVFRPLLRLLAEDGHDVEVTARDYAQTLELLELNGIAHRVVGPAHGGAGALGKARAMAGRLPALRRFAKGRRFDLALAHGSHEAMLVARSLGIAGRDRARLRVRDDAAPARPAGPRRGSSSRTPIPPERLARLRREAAEAAPATRGSRRSTTSPTSSPTRPSSRVSTPRRCSLWCARRRRCRSTTGTGTRSSPTCSNGSDATRRRTQSCCREPAEQRQATRALGAPVAPRPGACDRRPEPDRARRSRRLRRGER